MAEFQIDVVEDAATEIAALPAVVRKRVVEAIDAQLLHQPRRRCFSEFISGVCIVVSCSLGEETCHSI